MVDSCRVGQFKGALCSSFPWHLMVENPRVFEAQIFQRVTDMLKMRSILIVVCLSMLVVAQAIMAKSNEFPGRDLYPEIPFIEIKDLKAKFKDVVIVDVRSAYEYETLRIRGALNFPLASKTFTEDMQKLRTKTDKPIVVYCNGKTCMKSYKAVIKCMHSDIKGVTAFDAGVLDWAKNNPADALLLGKVLNDPKKLISKDDFKKHTITPDDFGNRIAETEAIVLDVRDRFQREGISLFVGREYRVYLDDTKRLDRFINKAINENKPLLIYDAAGKQVVWLQYYLQERGVKDYAFMDGGIHNYYKTMQESNHTSAKK